MEFKVYKRSLYLSYVKPTLDFIASCFLLVIASPILILLYALIKIVIGGPVIFTQTRAGLHGKIFTIYKFRTMTDKKDKDGNFLPDAERLTYLGKFLRKSSLDELPQFINVLKGDMSIIGPRPLLDIYLSRYTPEQLRRQDVKPGITGLAQVNGRNRLSWEEKFKLDVEYVNTVNLYLDAKIVLWTFICVLQQHGINAADHATMPEFLGTSEMTES